MVINRVNCIGRHSNIREAREDLNGDDEQVEWDQAFFFSWWFFSCTFMLSSLLPLLCSSLNTFHSQSLNFNSIDEPISAFAQIIHMHLRFCQYETPFCCALHLFDKWATLVPLSVYLGGWRRHIARLTLSCQSFIVYVIYVSGNMSKHCSMKW